MQMVGDKNPAADYDGITPLHLAAKNGHLDVCELIIQNIEIKNPGCKWSVTPKDFAGFEKHWKIVDLYSSLGIYTQYELLKRDQEKEEFE